MARFLIAHLALNASLVSHRRRVAPQSLRQTRREIIKEKKYI